MNIIIKSKQEYRKVVRHRAKKTVLVMPYVHYNISCSDINDSIIAKKFPFGTFYLNEYAHNEVRFYMLLLLLSYYK